MAGDDGGLGRCLLALGRRLAHLGLLHRAHGRFDQARPIALEMIAMSWPLPNGTLMLARGVSDVSDAPFIGEAAILLSLTQPVAPAFSEHIVPAGRRVPVLVLLMLLFYFGSALWLLRNAWHRIRMP